MTSVLSYLSGLGPVATGALGFAIGLGLGLVHFASLNRVAALYTDGGSVGRALALQLARLALLVVVMLLVAQLGALPLLAAALGILGGRAIILRRARKEE